jgi:hypothetical protein
LVVELKAFSPILRFSAVLKTPQEISIITIGLKSSGESEKGEFKV